MPVAFSDARPVHSRRVVEPHEILHGGDHGVGDPLLDVHQREPLVDLDRTDDAARDVIYYRPIDLVFASLTDLKTRSDLSWAGKPRPAWFSISAADQNLGDGRNGMRVACS